MVTLLAASTQSCEDRASALWASLILLGHELHPGVAASEYHPSRIAATHGETERLTCLSYSESLRLEQIAIGIRCLPTFRELYLGFARYLSELLLRRLIMYSQSYLHSADPVRRKIVDSDAKINLACGHVELLMQRQTGLHNPIILL
jgi:hypothetical protein